MSSRRRESLSPTLFPFLAVLICTLGTLILMLAILAHSGGKARAASDAPEEPTVDEVAIQELVEADAEIERRLGEARWHREHVVHMRDEQTSDLDERRTKRAHLEDHLRRLREELTRLETEVQAAVEKSETTVLSEAAIESLKAKIEGEKTAIEKLKVEQLSKQPRIVIVPHKGPNGTDRRPVYIECRADGVYLQPEGIAIDLKYLESDSPGSNPLDAALRTIRLHAMKNYGDTVAPYPLIVVRPDGIETYGAVRVAMHGWDDQYGYELVPDDVKLAYSEPDPLLKERVELAIAQAVQEQQAMQQFGQGRGRGGRGGTGAGAGRTVAANEAGSVENTSQLNGRDASAQAASGTPKRRASDFPILSARGLEKKAMDAAENEYRNSGANRGSRYGSPAQQAAAKSASAAAEENAADLSAEADLLAKGLGSSKNKPLDMSTSKSSYSGLNGSSQQGSPQQGSPQQGSPQQGQTQPGEIQPGEPRQGDTLGNQADAATSAADRFAPPSTVASRSRTPSASTDPNAPIGGTQSMGNPSANNPAGTAPQSPDAAAQAAKDAAANGATPQSPPRPNIKIDANSKTPPKSLVQRGDRDWALPRDVAASVGTKMVRAIRVECYSDRLVLLPEGGRGALNVYGFSDGDINRASLELATEVRDRVERWGAGMPGGRWHPLLSVTVVPGGEVRFQQLQRLLNGSGIELQSRGIER